MSIFKSCDIRGVFGDELTADTARRLGRALASRWPGTTVVVGRDLRPSSPELATALIDGLVASGAQVTDTGEVPTPVLYYAKRQHGFAVAVMVTASHNPPQYNGFKLMWGDLPVSPEDIATLADEMAAGDFVTAQGSVRHLAVVDAYLSFIRSLCPTLQPRRVVVDCGSGSMSTVAPGLLGQLGIAVIPLYCQPDGRFPFRDPNPAIARHLTNLCHAVVDQGAELGLAFDGDGDRVIAADGRGAVVPADRTLVLLIRDLLASQPGASVVYDQKSSSIVPEEIVRHGGRPLREKSGHAFIKRRLLIEDAALGGEISGHYFFRELGGDDALYACLALLRALDRLGASFTEAIASVPSYPISPDIRLPATPDVARRVLADLEASFSEQPVDHLDGVRIDFSDGWALARLSVTEPLITLRFEAHTQDRLAALQAEIRRASPTLERLWAAAQTRSAAH
jgi:phosphomannomutase/phosphoglucomutase